MTYGKASKLETLSPSLLVSITSSTTGNCKLPLTNASLCTSVKIFFYTEFMLCDDDSSPTWTRTMDLSVLIN